MRYPKVLSALLVFGFGLASISSQAQTSVLFNFDEAGVGSGQNSTVFVPIAGALAADPGPGGLASALTYSLLGPPSLVAGDVFLQEGVGGPVLDVLRFNPAGTGSPNYPASFVFYSDNIDGATDLADTPNPPTANYTNTLTLVEVGPEGSNGVTYIPTANQPGFIAGFTTTYHIQSDSTPEPGTVALCVGMGLSGASVFARRRKKARKAA
jgi:hypothetical protein